MRPAPNDKVEKFRYRTAKSLECAGTNNGAFIISGLQVIASDGGGWDHVSVSKPDKIPTWEEMCLIKRLFFGDDEVVMQLHPAKKDYVNVHPRCLHLWRPQTQAERDALSKTLRGADDCPEFPTPGPIPLPPKEMVG